MQFIIEDDKVCLGPREYPLPEGNDLPRLTQVNEWLATCSKELCNRIFIWFDEVTAILKTFPLAPGEKDTVLIVPEFPEHILPSLVEYVESISAWDEWDTKITDRKGKPIIITSKDHINLYAVNLVRSILSPLVELAKQLGYAIDGPTVLNFTRVFVNMDTETCGVRESLGKIAYLIHPKVLYINDYR